MRKVCPAWVPDGKGVISDAAFGVVLPVAGGRCVPRTGVRLDCPLGVALPVSLPCLSLLPYSGATCYSTRGRRAGLGTDGGECRGGRRQSRRWTWKFSWGKVSKGKQKSFKILFGIMKRLCARVAQRDPTQSSDDTQRIFNAKMGVREGQGQKQYETCRSSHGIWGLLTETCHNLKGYWVKILWTLRIGEARHPGPRPPPHPNLFPLSVLILWADFADFFEL